MAFEIKATPTLRGKNAKKFWDSYEDKSSWGTQSLEIKTKPSIKQTIAKIKKKLI